jgi:hypothetical protein
MQVRTGAVDAARKLKPSIPMIGEHGIAIHDELDLCRLLDPSAAVGASPWSQGHQQMLAPASSERPFARPPAETF